MGGHFKLNYGCLGPKPKGMTYEEKTYFVFIWRVMDNVFGALGVFFQAQWKWMGQMKIAKAHGYLKIVAIHL